MNLIERAKNILIKPKEEWAVISLETTSVAELCTKYLLILALIPALAQFIKFGLLGYSAPFVGHVGGSIPGGIRQAIISYVSTVAGAFISAFIIDALAPSFGSQKNFSRAFQLVVYSFTATMVAGIFVMIPGLSILTILGLYGLYILYLGMSPMMLTPEDKLVGYFVVSLIVIIAVYVVLGLILTAMLFTGAVITGM